MRTVHLIRSFTCLLGTLVLAGCASDSAETDISSSDHYLEAVPEQAAFEISVVGDAESEGLATADDAIDPAQAGSDMADDIDAGLAVTPGLEGARGAVRELNHAVRAFMKQIRAVVASEGQPAVGEGRVYGPVVRGSTEYRLALKRAAERRYGWVLDARAADTEDEFKHVAAGRIAVGEQARRGVGQAGFDLDALGTVDPSVVARGKLLVGFAHGPQGSTLKYALSNFTADPAEREPIDALFHAVHLKAGVRGARVAFRGNLPETETDAPELVLARTRHVRGVGGRADLVVVQGDVPEGQALVINECWNKQLEAGFRVVRGCAIADLGTGRCTNVVKTVGKLENCLPDFGKEQLPPLDPTAPAPDADDPNEVDVPGAMPNGDG
jgi:hypothetical protein